MCAYAIIFTDGLLEYLEDLIGSNKYVEAIEEGLEQVERLNELRQEKLNRVKLVEKEKDGLEVGFVDLKRCHIFAYTNVIS